MNIDSRVAERVVLRQLHSAARHHVSAAGVVIDGRHQGRCGDVFNGRVAEQFVLLQLQSAAHHHASAEVVEIDGRHRGQRVNVVACDVGTGRAATRLERQR